MSKSELNYYEEMGFESSADASEAIELYKAKLKNCKIALGIAIVSSIVFNLGMGYGKGIMIFVGIILKVVAYVWGGGFGDVFDLGVRIAKKGWEILPFPFDIPFGLITVYAAVMIAAAYPSVFILICYFKNKKKLRIAEKNLSYLQ